MDNLNGHPTIGDIIESRIQEEAISFTRYLSIADDERNEYDIKKATLDELFTGHEADPGLINRRVTNETELARVHAAISLAIGKQIKNNLYRELAVDAEGIATRREKRVKKPYTGARRTD